MHACTCIRLWGTCCDPTIVWCSMAVISATSPVPICRRDNRDAGGTSDAGHAGSALPTAIAAKLAYPDSRVVMLTGDGAFGFNAMEFDTAVRHNLPVVGILGNDSAWASIARSARPLRPSRGHRPAAEPLRDGGAGFGRAW